MLFSCLTLIRNGLSITQIPRLITDKSFRDMLLSNVHDPNAIHFFRASFDNLRPVDQLDQAQARFGASSCSPSARPFATPWGSPRTSWTSAG